MFEWLTSFDKILVTGPQRSGTRICAQMIAYDTGYDYIDENDLDMDSLYILSSFLQDRRRLVVQCPVLCRYVHTFGADDTAIVLMRRNVQEIVASQKRIRWAWEWLELARYDRTEGIIAEVKYRFWEENQKGRIQHAFEIEYESLAGHPLWVPEHSRQDFRPSQTAHRLEGPGISSNACPRPRLEVLCWDRSDPDAALLVKTRQPAKSLNETGRLIWSLCDGTRTFQDILRAFKAHFEAVDENRLATDLERFIRDLVEQGFLWLSSNTVVKNGPETGP